MPRPALRLGPALLALAAFSAVASADDGPAVTVYSSADPAGFDPQAYVQQQRSGWSVGQVPGFGVVKEVRAIDLAQGLNVFSFTDVAEFIDPTTVSFTDLTSPGGTTVLEQSFQFDLASPSKILERYVDRQIGWDAMKDGQVVGHVDGTVLSVNQGQIVLRTPDGGLRFISARDPGIRLPSLPAGLITKPTLVWKVFADAAGRHDARTTYQTSGMTWRADYNLVLNADDTKADLGAWVTLLNLSGAAYPNARLKLIAGDVQRVQPPMMGPSSSGNTVGGFGGSKPAGFEEKAFFEYHLYTLPRRTDVLQNATQQIALFPTATGAGVEKAFVYYGYPEGGQSWGPNPRTDRDIRSQANPKVDVYVRLENRKENHLGMPLPRGKVRVYKSDEADGTLEFVGEDLIDHTPKDERLVVKVGQAFDVVGERTQTNFTLDPARKVMSESYRITLRNHKEAAVRVTVKENLFRWVNWEMVETSDPFSKVDARTVHFDVDVPGNGEKTVMYTVRYTW